MLLETLQCCMIWLLNSGDSHAALWSAPDCSASLVWRHRRREPSCFARFRGELPCAFRKTGAAIARCGAHAPGADSELALRGAKGLYAASKSVERHEWKAYVAGLSLEEKLPGLRGMAFIAAVPQTQLADFLKVTREDNTPGFQIKPVGEREEMRPIKYFEPAEVGQEAIGFDTATLPEAVEAQNRARDTGAVALSAKFTCRNSKTARTAS
jgi:hypothetical protein